MWVGHDRKASIQISNSSQTKKVLMMKNETNRLFIKTIQFTGDATMMGSCKKKLRYKDKTNRHHFVRTALFINRFIIIKYQC